MLLQKARGEHFIPTGDQEGGARLFPFAKGDRAEKLTLLVKFFLYCPLSSAYVKPKKGQAEKKKTILFLSLVLKKQLFFFFREEKKEAFFQA